MCVKSPTISFVYSRNSPSVERHWGMVRDRLNYCRKKTRVISHPIISPFTPILCQDRSISPHLLHPVWVCGCVSAKRDRIYPDESISGKDIALGLDCCVSFTSRSACGRLLWMQLTFRKYTLNSSKTFWRVSVALQSVMHHNTSHQRFKEIYASKESRGAEISFESSAVAFYKPINSTLDSATD